MSTSTSKALLLLGILLAEYTVVCKGAANLKELDFQEMNEKLLQQLHFSIPLNELGLKRMQTEVGLPGFGFIGVDISFGENDETSQMTCKNLRFDDDDVALSLNALKAQNDSRLYDILFNLQGFQVDCKLPLSITVNRVGPLTIGPNTSEKKTESGLVVATIRVKSNQKLTLNRASAAPNNSSFLDLGDCNVGYVFEELVLHRVFTNFQELPFPLNLAEGFLNDVSAQFLPDLLNEELDEASCLVLKQFFESVGSRDIFSSNIDSLLATLSNGAAMEETDLLSKSTSDQANDPPWFQVAKKMVEFAFDSMDDPFNLLDQYLLETESSLEAFSLLENFDLLKALRVGGLIPAVAEIAQHIVPIGPGRLSIAASLQELILQQHELGHIGWSAFTLLENSTFSTPSINLGSFSFTASANVALVGEFDEGLSFSHFQSLALEYDLEDEIQVTGRISDLEAQLGIYSPGNLDSIWDLPLDRLLLEPLKSILEATARGGNVAIKDTVLAFTLEQLHFSTESTDAMMVFITDILNAGVTVYTDKAELLLKNLAQSSLRGFPLSFEGLLEHLDVGQSSQLSASEQMLNLLSLIPQNPKELFFSLLGDRNRRLVAYSARSWSLLQSPFSFKLDFITRLSLKVHSVRVLPPRAETFTLDSVLQSGGSSNRSMSLTPRLQLEPLKILVELDMNISEMVNRFELELEVVDAGLLAEIIATFENGAFKKLTARDLFNPPCWFTTFSPPGGINRLAASITALLVGLTCEHCDSKVFGDLSKSLKSSAGVASLAVLLNTLLANVSTYVTDAFHESNWNSTYSYAHEACFGYQAYGYHESRHSPEEHQDLGQSAYFMLALLGLFCIFYWALACVLGSGSNGQVTLRGSSLVQSPTTDLSGKIGTTGLLLGTIALFGYSALQFVSGAEIEELSESVDLQNTSWLTTVLASLTLPLPLVKLIATVYCWLAPECILASSRRGNVLHFLDKVGKWSLLEIFALLYAYCFTFVKLESPRLPFLPSNMYAITIQAPIPAPIISFGVAVLLGMIASNICLWYHYRSVEPVCDVRETLRLSRSGQGLAVTLTVATYCFLFCLWALPVVHIGFYGLAAKAISLGGEEVSRSLSLLDIFIKTAYSTVEPTFYPELIFFLFVLFATNFVAPFLVGYGTLYLTIHGVSVKDVAKVQFRQALFTSWSTFLVVYVSLIICKMDFPELIKGYVDAESTECMEMKSFMRNFLEPLQFVSRKDVEAACFGVSIGFGSGIIFILVFSIFATIQQFVVEALLKDFRCHVVSLERDNKKDSTGTNFWLRTALRLHLVSLHNSQGSINTSSSSVVTVSVENAEVEDDSKKAMHTDAEQADPVVTS